MAFRITNSADPADRPHFAVSFLVYHSLLFFSIIAPTKLDNFMYYTPPQLSLTHTISVLACDFKQSGKQCGARGGPQDPCYGP